MLKSVNYRGFDAHPDLRVRVEAMMPFVEDELQMRADHTAITWEPRQTGDLVQFEIRDDWFGAKSAVLPSVSNERAVRYAVRELHMTLLGEYLRSQVNRMDQYASTSVGD